MQSIRAVPASNSLGGREPSESDWQEAHFRFWTFTGYSVTVISRYGSRIEQGFVNQGQARFLSALRRFVPREAFDAGLYEWHPDAPIATS